MSLFGDIAGGIGGILTGAATGFGQGFGASLGGGLVAPRGGPAPVILGGPFGPATTSMQPAPIVQAGLGFNPFESLPDIPGVDISEVGLTCDPSLYQPRQQREGMRPRTNISATCGNGRVDQWSHRGTMVVGSKDVLLVKRLKKVNRQLSVALGQTGKR